MLALLTLPLLQTSQAVVIAAVMVWGAAYGAIPLCLSVWMQMSSPDHPEACSALFVTTVKVSIAFGSLGGAIVDHIGIAATMRAGGLLALLSLAVIVTFRTRGTTLKQLLQP
ncbi:MFS transporter [Paraburkholderia sp. LEh10]|jgi:predicted MFS family arabinose efflux permease|uniref:MFS transporter n=1 Tax=Paraburkholderia sp. LEh10 TaxID=2821353 RepID=UPI001AE1D426|nr:MFS transporter [Paraburkholderia sp. LEh10]MBP0592327.1 MFS transporter [Paraburkholderia sp. LEh10]